jgi:hypothetical protein
MPFPPNPNQTLTMINAPDIEPQKWGFFVLGNVDFTYKSTKGAMLGR